MFLDIMDSQNAVDFNLKIKEVEGSKVSNQCCLDNEISHTSSEWIDLSREIKQKCLL